MTSAESSATGLARGRASLCRCVIHASRFARCANTRARRRTWLRGKTMCEDCVAGMLVCPPVGSRSAPRATRPGTAWPRGPVALQSRAGGQHPWCRTCALRRVLHPRLKAPAPVGGTSSMKDLVRRRTAHRRVRPDLVVPVLDPCQRGAEGTVVERDNLVRNGEEAAWPLWLPLHHRQRSGLLDEATDWEATGSRPRRRSGLANQF